MFARRRTSLVTIASLLVFPLALLLFLQWPLRAWVQAGGLQANDLAQTVFALYMAVAVTAASRAGAHLSAHGAAAPRQGRWRPVLTAACVLPWSGFLLWSATPLVWRSVQALERFPDSLLPGYFLIKLALWLLACLVLVDAVAQLWRAPGQEPH